MKRVEFIKSSIEGVLRFFFPSSHTHSTHSALPCQPAFYFTTLPHAHVPRGIFFPPQKTTVSLSEERSPLGTILRPRFDSKLLPFFVETTASCKQRRRKQQRSQPRLLKYKLREKAKQRILYVGCIREKIILLINQSDIYFSAFSSRTIFYKCDAFSQGQN